MLLLCALRNGAQEQGKEGEGLSVSWLRARSELSGVLERPLLSSCSKHPWAAGEAGCASAQLVPLHGSGLRQQLAWVISGIKFSYLACCA